MAAEVAEEAAVTGDGTAGDGWAPAAAGHAAAADACEREDGAVVAP